ncbi:hypothetical protein AVEN_156776-2-1, partial [Araneus ventricosus]
DVLRASIKLASIAREILNIWSSLTIEVVISWVKGHSGVLGNEVADQSARQATHGSSLKIKIDLPKSCLKKFLKKCSREIWQDSLSTFRQRNFPFVPQVNINRTSFDSKINQFITGHGPSVTNLHRFGLCSHDRCVCGAKGDPNHYATVCPVTKSFHFLKPSAETPSIPDLAPSDFHFSLKLKELRGGKRFGSDEELENAVTTWLNELAAEEYDMGILKLVDRYDICLNVGGDYVEK